MEVTVELRTPDDGKNQLCEELDGRMFQEKEIS